MAGLRRPGVGDEAAAHERKGTRFQVLGFGDGGGDGVLVKEVIQCRNGDLVRLSPTAGIIDEVPSGRLYKDGSLLVEADARTVADRKRLSFAGAVSVALALNDKGVLAADPELDLIGIPERDRDGGLIAETVNDAVLETLESLLGGLLDLLVDFVRDVLQHA